MATQQLTKKQGFSSPTAIPALLWKHYRYSLSACIHGEIPHDRALEPEARKSLENRLSLIKAWFAPAGEDNVKDHIAILFTVMAHRQFAEMDSKILIRVYMADLADLPAFALQRACERFRKGEAGDGKWVPSIGELRAETRRLCEDLEREKAEIVTVLTARVLAPPPKTSIKDLADKILSELSDRNAAKRTQTREEAEAAVAAGFPHLRKPLTVSDELRHTNALRTAALLNAGGGADV
jgi:hypothetical protein